ncbi:MAG: mannonate dehydratase [Saprospiraceae bacterium]|nr:mannonate dehydratase [Saprospiraceae bacterium]
MRWFGPTDLVSLSDIAQAGAQGVVTALHGIPIGSIWTTEAITTRKLLINELGLDWTVVESLPVHEEIKMRTGQFELYIQNYCESLRNLAVCGLEVVTYNFMPVFDWVRTDIAHPLPNQSEALLYDHRKYELADLFLLERPEAKAEMDPAQLEKLQQQFDRMSAVEKQELFQCVFQALPGSSEALVKDQVLAAIAQYQDIDAQQLRNNLIAFLEAVVPVAEEVGIQLAIHPDDPPFSVFGLPRILSTAADVEYILAAVPYKANGLCFCTGSFGAHPENDLLRMLKEWGSRIHFFHLRNTKRDGPDRFWEASLLEGDTDMYEIVKEAVYLMQKEQRSIPMRPDHGHKMLDDLGKAVYPGYGAIGRLKSLAELRGLEYAVLASTVK